jgi:hypothetical protein
MFFDVSFWSVFWWIFFGFLYFLLFKLSREKPFLLLEPFVFLLREPVRELKFRLELLGACCLPRQNRDGDPVLQHLTEEQRRKHSSAYTQFIYEIGRYKNYNGGLSGWLEDEGLPPSPYLEISRSDRKPRAKNKRS